MKEIENMSIQDLREEKEGLQRFVQSSIWKTISSTIEAQKTARQQQVMLTPLGSHDEALGMEFCKGEYAAFSLIGEFPQLLLESVEIALAEKLKDIENGSESPLE